MSELKKSFGALIKEVKNLRSEIFNNREERDGHNKNMQTFHAHKRLVEAKCDVLVSKIERLKKTFPPRTLVPIENKKFITSVIPARIQKLRDHLQTLPVYTAQKDVVIGEITRLKAELEERNEFEDANKKLFESYKERSEILEALKATRILAQAAHDRMVNAIKVISPLNEKIDQLKMKIKLQTYYVNESFGLLTELKAKQELVRRLQKEKAPKFSVDRHDDQSNRIDK